MKKSNIFFVLLAVFFLSNLNAEFVTSEKFNYSLDLPEMFYIEDFSKDETSILFKNQKLPVELACRVWNKKDYSSSKKCLSETLKKIYAAGEISSFEWNTRACSISEFEINEKVFGKKMKGWAVCSPLSKSENFLTLLCYTSEKTYFDSMQFILSVLDSLILDKRDFKTPGIITTFAFPRNSPQKINLNIQNKIIPCEIDSIDEEAATFVIDREFAVFSLYTDEKCWKEAWQRFYRLIERDTIERVKKCSLEIFKYLTPLAISSGEENPDFAIAQILLNWVQNFDYQRKSASASKADFQNIPSVLKGKPSDCDSRSLLLFALFKTMNIESVMLISVDYSHAMIAVNFEGKQGQTFSYNNKEYLFGETTAKNLTFGKIDSAMQDRKKWIPVEFYE